MPEFAPGVRPRTQQSQPKAVARRWRIVGGAFLLARAIQSLVRLLVASSACSMAAKRSLSSSTDALVG